MVDHSSDGVDRNLEQFSDAEQRELLQVFLDDLHDQLDHVDDAVLKLELEGAHRELLDVIYRAFHSIKGTAGTFGFAPVTETTHQLESVLDDVRKGRLPADTAFCDLLFAATGLLKQSAAALTAGEEYEAPLEILNRTIASYTGRAGTQPPSPAAAPETPATEEVPSVEHSSGSASRDESIRIRLDKVNKLIDLSGEIAIRKNYGQLTIPKIQEIVTLIDDAAAELEKKDAPSALPDAVKSFQAETLAGIRKKTEDLLDSFSQWHFQLNMLVEQIKYETLRTRLVPVGMLFTTLRLSIRDLARKTGKQVEFQTTGEELELDKRVLEEIQDPLQHLIRNAVDHGIELPEVRRAAGKPETGIITITVSQIGNDILLELRDDGAGLNWDRIRAKAIEGGFADPEDVAAMSTEDLSHLLCRPGFSTRDTADAVSGRGVGMDVVATNLHRINGHLKIQSTPGAGTAFLLRIPTTLTAAKALIFETGGHMFAVPTTVVASVASLPETVVIDTVRRAALVNGSPLALVEWRALLQMPPAVRDDTAFLQIILLDTGESRMGLIIDRFLDVQDVVIRPLQPGLPRAELFNAVTSLPDGSLTFILNAAEVILAGEQWEKEHTEWALIEYGAVKTSEFHESAGQDEAVVCRSGDLQFAVPAVSIRRVLRVPARPADELRKRSLVFDRIRFPVVDVSRLFKTDKRNTTHHAIFLLLDADGRQMMVEVDEILGYHQVSFNPLEESSEYARWCSFETAVASGERVPVLEPGQAMRRIERLLPDAVCRMDQSVAGQSVPDSVPSGEAPEAGVDGTALLLFDAGTATYGVNFNHVLRVSQVTSVARFNTREKDSAGYLSYRGDCVPVFDLRKNGVLPAGDSGDEAGAMIFVEQYGVKNALAVDAIGDVVPATGLKTVAVDLLPIHAGLLDVVKVLE